MQVYPKKPTWGMRFCDQSSLNKQKYRHFALGSITKVTIHFFTTKKPEIIYELIIWI